MNRIFRSYYYCDQTTNSQRHVYAISGTVFILLPLVLSGGLGYILYKVEQLNQSVLLSTAGICLLIYIGLGVVLYSGIGTNQISLGAQMTTGEILGLLMLVVSITVIISHTHKIKQGSPPSK